MNPRALRDRAPRAAVRRRAAHRSGELTERIDRPRSPLVLIVEDDLDARMLYAREFLIHGFRVTTAMDGEMAFRDALAFRPDAIVMDLSLPRVDGWEAARRLKTDARTASIPVLACTAHAVGSAPERALVAGCDAFLAKPCLPPEVVREVQRLLDRPQQRRA